MSDSNPILDYNSPWRTRRFCCGCCRIGTATLFAVVCDVVCTILSAIRFQNGLSHCSTTNEYLPHCSLQKQHVQIAVRSISWLCIIPPCLHIVGYYLVWPRLSIPYIVRNITLLTVLILTCALFVHVATISSLERKNVELSYIEVLLDETMHDIVGNATDVHKLAKLSKTRVTLVLCVTATFLVLGVYLWITGIGIATYCYLSHLIKEKHSGILSQKNAPRVTLVPPTDDRIDSMNIEMKLL